MRSTLSITITAAAAEEWFFGANITWKGPASYKTNRMPAAPAAARKGTHLRWVPNSRLCDGTAPLNNTCSPTGFASPRLPHIDACAAAGQRSILVVGDSYARHFYMGLALLLSGDYRSGALMDVRTAADSARRAAASSKKCTNERQLGEYGLGNRTCRFADRFATHYAHNFIADHEKCTYARQFGEHGTENRRACRKLIRRQISACGTNLTLVEAACPLLKDAYFEQYDVIFYGFGAHPCLPGGIKGPKHLIYNVSAVLDIVQCRAHAWIWLDTHFRPTQFMPYDSPFRVATFHDELPPRLFEKCGVPFVSAFEDTRTLVATPGTGWRRMTFDGVHWGLQINIIKALRAIELMQERTNAYRADKPEAGKTATKGVGPLFA